MLRIVLGGLAVHVGRELAQRLVGRCPHQRRRHEADGARRRVVEVELEVQLGALVLRVAAGGGDDRGEQRRQHHQQLLDRLVVDDADPAQVGQAGGQHRERRADTGERGVGLVDGARGGGQQSSRSCGSAWRTSEVNRASPSDSDLMSSPERIWACRNGPT